MLLVDRTALRLFPICCLFRGKRIIRLYFTDASSVVYNSVEREVNQSARVFSVKNIRTHRTDRIGGNPIIEDRVF